MARPVRPTDLYVTNGWYMEIPGLISPHFETLDGLGIESSTVQIVDAGTNMEYKFPSQIIRFPELTLARTLQGTTDDVVWEDIVNRCIREGLKFDCTVVKLHNGVEAFRLSLVGFRVQSFTYPSFDVNGEDKFLVNYTCTTDYWIKI
jgi:hypothetical protein